MKIYEINLKPQHVWDMLCKAMSAYDILNTLDQKLIENAFCSADLSKMECHPWDHAIDARDLLVNVISELNDFMISNPDNLIYLMENLLFSLIKTGFLEDARLDAFLTDYPKYKHEIFSNSTPISLHIIPKQYYSLVGKTYISHMGDTVTFSDDVMVFLNKTIRILREGEIYTQELVSNRQNFILSNENVVLKTWVG